MNKHIQNREPNIITIILAISLSLLLFKFYLLNVYIKEKYNDNMDCTQLSAIYMDLPRPYYHCKSSMHVSRREKIHVPFGEYLLGELNLFYIETLFF